VTGPRAFHLPPWRIDLTVRPGVPRIVPAVALARTIRTALEAAGAPRSASIGLILTDDREMTDLNATHMGQAGPTDVLSFPLLPPEVFPGHEGRPGHAGATPVALEAAGVAGTAAAAAAIDFPLPPGARLHLGDIVVSVERAVEQADRGRGGWTGDVRWSPADELRLLVTHGTLHVCGWDHAEPVEEAAMRLLERRLLEGPARG
jgi:probable rRNA maturation factor